MSVADVLAEIQNLTADERREVARFVSILEESGETPESGLRVVNQNGKLLLAADRVIRQEEVNRILAEQ